MKITVINATEKHGVTYRLKERFLQEFEGRRSLSTICPRIALIFARDVSLAS